MLKDLLTELASRSSYSEEEEDHIRWATGTLFGGKSKSQALAIACLIVYPQRERIL